MSEDVAISITRVADTGDIPLPCYMTENAAGMDIFAAVSEKTTIAPGERLLVPTGFAIALPRGYEAQIRPRSGLALKSGLTVLNSPGTIDADYRGEVKIIVINHGNAPFTINRGDRIAQMVIHRVSKVLWNIKGALDITSRNEKGFGHTGA